MSMVTDKPLLHDWLLLQSTEHFRHMSHTDAFGSYYESPYEAFINYMNVLADFLERVDAQYPTSIENEELNALLKTINNQEKEIEELQKEVKRLRARKAKAKEGRNKRVKPLRHNNENGRIGKAILPFSFVYTDNTIGRHHGNTMLKFGSALS